MFSKPHEALKFTPDREGQQLFEVCNWVVMNYATRHEKSDESGNGNDPNDQTDREDWAKADGRWKVFEVSFTQGWKTTKRWLDAKGRDVTNAKDM